LITATVIAAIKKRLSQKHETASLIYIHYRRFADYTSKSANLRLIFFQSKVDNHLACSLADHFYV